MNIPKYNVPFFRRGGLSSELVALIDAGEKAGALLYEGFYSEYDSHVKADQSEHTPFDKLAEDLAREIFENQLGKDYEIFGEESKRQKRPDDLRGQKCIFIDGIDGTTNFSRRIPLFNFTANIALPTGPDGSLEVEAGVVIDPIHGELYYAQRGKGAYCNGQKIEVVNREPSKALSTFAPLLHVRGDAKGDHEQEKVEALWQGERKFAEVSRRFTREFQCGGLELAWVACGRLDSYASSWTNPWDLGAGALLVREAGGIATDIYGNEWQPSYHGVIAGSQTVYPALYNLLSAKFQDLRSLEEIAKTETKLD